MLIKNHILRLTPQHLFVHTKTTHRKRMVAGHHVFTDPKLGLKKDTNL